MAVQQARPTGAILTLGISFPFMEGKKTNTSPFAPGEEWLFV